MHTSVDDNVPAARRTSPEVSEEVPLLELSSSSTTPVESCLTPRAVLALFCCLNLLVYFDRGAAAGALTAIQHDDTIHAGGTGLSDTQCGLIISAFMIGFMLTCPLFASLGTTVRSKWVMLAGMVVWVVACVGTAAAWSFVSLLLSRMLVGVGEAAFVGITITIIDNIAPPTQRTTWIGVYYAMMPVGQAAGMYAAAAIGARGFVSGTQVAAWRVTFLIEVVLSLPVLFLLACLPTHYDVRRDETEAHTPLWEATKMLARNTNYVLLVFGYAMYCFVSGAVAVWAIPLLVQGPLHLQESSAALIVGVVIFTTGLIGSMVGGVVVDWLATRDGSPAAGAISCVLFSITMVLVSLPSGLCALLVTTRWLFVLALTCSVMVLFAVTAPLNACILVLVPSILRPYAVSYAVLCIHLLGDFLSPTFAGMLSDLFSQSCYASRTADDCEADPSRHCRWIHHSTEANGSCVHVMQCFMAHHAGLDARAVLVYIDDTHGTVSREDLQDWLCIVDEVEELKLQYDATRCRSCYYVRFRTAAAAQLAAQHLNGVLLKGCLVTLLPASGASSADAKTTTSSTETPSPLGQVEMTFVSDSLPHNHEMPEELRVDGALLEYIALLDGDNENDDRYPGHGALLTTLRELQARMADVQRRVTQIDEHASRSDEKLAQAVNATQAMNTDRSTEVLSDSLTACFGNMVGIPLQWYTAATLLSRVVTFFGPVARAGYMIDDFTQTFYVRFSFVMHEDAETFAAQLCQPPATVQTSEPDCSTDGSEATGDVMHVSFVKQLRHFNWFVRAEPEWPWPRPTLLNNNEMSRVKELIQS